MTVILNVILVNICNKFNIYTVYGFLLSSLFDTSYFEYINNVYKTNNNYILPL